MLNVSEATKNAYKSSSNKYITIYFPELDLTFDNDVIAQESLSIEELLEADEYLTFIGCNSSKATFSLLGVTTDLKNQEVIITIQADNTEIIPLFHGYVDTQTLKNYTNNLSELVAYDVLYTLSKTDVASWYINLDWDSTWTVKSFRDALFQHINLDVVATNLVNDNITFTKQYSPVQLSALNLIKYICQLNGVFGIINRNGVFEFRQLRDILVQDEDIDFYRTLDYQRYTVSAITKVIVRQSDLEEGVTVGTGTNTYIMQGNFFTLNQDEEVLETIATNIVPNVSSKSYVPFESTISGYPWIEVGDILQYSVYDPRTNTSTDINFYVLSRKLSGIQALNDNQIAEGDKERSIFISNINAQIDTIRDQIENIQGKIQSLDLKYVMFYNEDDVDITDGQSGVIANVDFAVSKECQVHFELEYLLECETTETIADNIITNNDLNITLLYEFDGQIIDSREPQETYQDGRHVLSAYYVFNIRDTIGHTLKIWLTCGGGSVHIDAFKAQNTLLGLGTLVANIWDGSIRVNETVLPISVAAEIMTLATATDDVTITLIPPIRISASDDIQSPVISDGVQIANITEEVSVDTEQE